MSEFWLAVGIPVFIGAFFISVMQLGKRFVLNGLNGSILGQQIVVEGGYISPLQFLIFWYGLSTVLYLCCYIFIWGFTMPALLAGFWTTVVGHIIADAFTQFLNAKAASLHKGEVSLTAPLQAMTPGLIILLALTLGEFPTIIATGGVLFMASASYMLAFEKRPEKWYGYFAPFQRIKLLFEHSHASEEEKNRAHVVALSLGSAAMGTIGLIFGGLMTRRGQDMQGLFLGAMAVTVGLMAVYFISYLRRSDAKTHQTFSNCWKRRSYFIVFFVIAAAWIIHIYFINPAFNEAYVAYVGTLKRFSILISMMLGFLILDEAKSKKIEDTGRFLNKERVRRLTAATLIIIGAFLIATDDLPTRIATKIEGLGI